MLAHIQLGEEGAREEAAQRELSALQQQYFTRVPSETHVLVGEAAPAIVAYAGDGMTRLITMPTRGFGLFRRMLLGSVTAKVLHDAKVPVLTGPHSEQAALPRYLARPRRILCALSLDWETDSVLKEGSAVARQFGAELMAVHVITLASDVMLPLIISGDPAPSSESVKQAMHEALARTEVSAEVQVVTGDISREVVAVATDRDVDMIVVGKGGAPELFGRLGSHEYAIIRRAPCPVLCV